MAIPGAQPGHSGLLPFILWSRPFILWSRPLWATTGVTRERQACAYGEYRGSAVHHAGRPARRARRGAGDPVADGRARPGAGEFAALRARVGPRAARRHARAGGGAAVRRRGPALA